MTSSKDQETRWTALFISHITGVGWNPTLEEKTQSLFLIAGSEQTSSRPRAGLDDPLAAHLISAATDRDAAYDTLIR